METFPVITSTLAPTQLGLSLQDKYKLSVHASCSLLKTGINHSYLVNSNADKYVFRVYSIGWRSKKEISEEIRLLDLLKMNGMTVSYPIADADGNYIQEFDAPEGKRYGVMFSFAKGEKSLNYSTGVHYKVGRIMAEIHRLTAGLQLDRVTYSPNVILMESFDHLKRFISIDSDEMAFMASAQKYLIDILDHADTGQIRTGAVHLDIWFDNLTIDERGEVALFDFDFCGNAWLCYDIAYYILQLNSTEKDEEECRSKTQAFLDGYESVTKITNEEKRLLPALGVSLYFFYLGVQCRRFDNWSNVFLNDIYLKRFINLLVKKFFEKNNLGK